MRILHLLIALCSLPAVGFAAFDPAVLEEIGGGFADPPQGLETYRVNIETEKVDEMLEKMTAAMPPGAPRPPAPVLRKYWSARWNSSVVRAEGRQVFPYMQEMVERFSDRFAVDLRTLFFPPGAADARFRLIEGAEVKSHETLLGDTSTLTVELVFPVPVDLAGAFFGRGLGLPQGNIRALAFDLDPGRKLIKRMEIVTSDTPKLSVEFRYEETPEGAFLPQEIRVTSPDGRIDDRLETVFKEVDGFHLPVRQTRTVVRPRRRESVNVRFTGYRINIPIPQEVAEQLSPSGDRPRIR